MAGSYYIALSGMRARLEALDRLASDIANVSTAGYKAERATTAQSDRGDFGASLQAAIDVGGGPTRIDLRAGAIAPTGRDLDVAIDGPGMFAIDTPSGTRYTRDGRFVRRADGVLTTASGMTVEGANGAPISLGRIAGPVRIDADGTVRSNGVSAGRLNIVEFENPGALIREGTDQFRSDDEDPGPAVESAIRGGALEQSNVSIVDRIAELTSVSRNFENMQKALSTLANDIDLRAITELGRR
jgi:flagellar basal body rod protein FlgG